MGEDKQKRGLLLKESIRGLRKGYTTGACAAAATKAAMVAFLTKENIKTIQITLPIGQTITLPLHKCKIEKDKAVASIIKDAGDDPDITNGAEIQAEIQGQGARGKGQGYNKAFQFTVHNSQFTIFGGKGIGIVTKPGLAVKVGEPAINPVPRKMIENAIKEALTHYSPCTSYHFITISVTNGEEMAKKTLNPRLGIIGGISILGTTGIVEPLSLSAYCQSISCAIDVALASKCKELVFSTGRTSEKVAESILDLPKEAFILVADHMGFALKEAGIKGHGAAGLKKITIVGQFGKISKLSAGYFDTHYLASNIELKFIAKLAKEAGAKSRTVEEIERANTAREAFFILRKASQKKIFELVYERIINNSKKIVGNDRIEMRCILAGYDNEIISS